MLFHIKIGLSNFLIPVLEHNAFSTFNNVEETAAYLNIGKTKTREIMKDNEKIFVVRIGNRNYAHKTLLDKWLLAQIKN